MVKLLNSISFRFLKLFFFFLLSNNILYSQSFEIPKDFIEGPLIFPHETIITGITKVLPVSNYFSKYSYIELSKVNKKVNNPNLWLEDKLYDELGSIADLERLLRNKDSPFSDPIFNQFKNIPLHINDTLEQLAINPLTYCDSISKLLNFSGTFIELNCTVPFGFYNKYLILRLQYYEDIWYFKKITSLSYKRIKELVRIAETFKGK